MDLRSLENSLPLRPAIQKHHQRKYGLKNTVRILKLKNRHSVISKITNSKSYSQIRSNQGLQLQNISTPHDEHIGPRPCGKYF